MPDRRAGIQDIACKALTRFRTRGAGEIASLAWARSKETAYARDKLIVLTRTSGGQRPVEKGLELRRALPADAHRYASDVGTDAAGTFRARLESGTDCYIVLEGERIVHATWLTRTAAWTREVGGYLVPPRAHAYVYESFTAAAQRGKGIYPFALNGICADAAVEALERIWVAVENDNLPSLRAVTKAGFEAAFEISYRRRLGRLTVSPPAMLVGAPAGPLLLLRANVEGGADRRRTQ